MALTVEELRRRRANAIDLAKHYLEEAAGYARTYANTSRNPRDEQLHTLLVKAQMFAADAVDVGNGDAAWRSE